MGGPERLLIAFTGTQPWELPMTLVDDFLIQLVDFAPTGGKVGRGFNIAWNSVKDFVLPNITSEVSEVWITGHSLGGSITTLASAEIKIRYPHLNVITYTFASPRTGDSMFSSVYDSL